MEYKYNYFFLPYQLVNQSTDYFPIKWAVRLPKNAVRPSR
jgi:hypothetical protein